MEVLPFNLVSQIPSGISTWTVRVSCPFCLDEGKLIQSRGMYSIAGAFSGLIAVSTFNPRLRDIEC